MQRRSLCVALVAGLLLAAAPFTSAVPLVFNAVLSAANEVPSNPSTATGFATVTFDIDNHLLTVDVTWAGLTSLPTAAHIHCCAPPGSNASVATQTPTFVGFPSLLSGTYFNTFDTLDAATDNASFIGAGTVAEAEMRLFDNMRDHMTYFNLHTDINRGGEIRGNLSEVPEPATLGLIGAGLLGLVGVARRRHA